MKQYSLSSNHLILTSKRAPVIPRAMMFFFAFLGFIAPVLSMIFSIAMKNGVHFVHFIFLVIFGLIGFYLLRIALWNTYGKENVCFTDESFSYIADYGWFKDRVKEWPYEHIDFSIQAVGYEDEGKGVLVLHFGDETIRCATKMPIDQIELLISELVTILDES